jgi:hypothetical protein
MAVSAEEALHNLKPPQTCRFCQIERCAPAREVFRRLRLAVRQAASNQPAWRLTDLEDPCARRG